MARGKIIGMDPNKCVEGYYWVKLREGKPSKPKIMMRGLQGKWWDVGWDIDERDMSKYIILEEVAKPTNKASGGDKKE